MEAVIKIIRKNHPCFVTPKFVHELDKEKCSYKFLENNLPDSTVVYIKCDENGELDLRGKRKEYRILKKEEI